MRDRGPYETGPSYLRPHEGKGSEREFVFDGIDILSVSTGTYLFYQIGRG